jgi:hypothetical protein
MIVAAIIAYITGGSFHHAVVLSAIGLGRRTGNFNLVDIYEKIHLGATVTALTIPKVAKLGLRKEAS